MTICESWRPWKGAILSQPDSPAGTSRPADPAFFAKILEDLPEVVVVTDLGGRIIYANAGLEALLGWTPAEAEGQPITLLLPKRPDRRVDPVQWLARWAAESDLTLFRYLALSARHRDGREIPIEVRVRPADTGDGRAGYVLTVRDDTVRRREHTTLKDANLRAARILMVAEDAIVSIDADQKIIIFNPAAERMFGYSAEEVIGQPLSMLIPQEFRSTHGAWVEAFSHAKEASRMMGDRPAVRGRRRSGEVFRLEATITRVLAAGSLTYTAHLRDVTERDRARDALLESERRIRAVFDHATEAIALLTPGGMVVEINRSGSALAGGAQGLVGLDLWEVPWNGVDLASDPAAGNELKAAIAEAGAGKPARLDAEIVKDGRPLSVEVRLTPIPDAAGAVAYILAEGRFEG